jgi:site-specific DNA-cytosine methylase
VSEPLAWYSEIDPKAAATLRELIKQGHIAPGVVDERSIEDVSPVELVGYTQRHYFAGGGVWSYALRAGGWPDHWPVVTGSCPCQPFSSAGKGKGFADERHLWPSFHWHIRFGEPVPVFGEQVASKDGLTWLDSVSADLEGSGYQIGATDTCAAGFGAPHIRQRLYWMGYPASYEQWRDRIRGFGRSSEIGGSSTIDRLASASRKDGEWGSAGTGEAIRGRSCGGLAGPSASRRLEDSNRSGGDGRTRGGEQSLRDERGGEFVGLAQPELPERRTETEGRIDDVEGPNSRWQEEAGGCGVGCGAGRLAHAGCPGQPQLGGRWDEREGPSKADVIGRMGSPIREGSQGLTGDGDGSNKPGRLDTIKAGSVTTPRSTSRVEYHPRDGRGEWRSESDGRGTTSGCSPSGVYDTLRIGLNASRFGNHGRDEPLIPRATVENGGEPFGRPGPTNGFWRDPDWLLCRDEWWRPVEAGTFPLAHGAAERMGRLRMYGNAIVAPQAAIFVEAAIEELKERGVIA